MMEIDSGAARLASGPISDLWKFIKDQKEAWSTKGEADSLYRSISEEIHRIKHVKTIWRFDNATNLEEFFCPPTLDFKGQQVELDTLETNGFENPFVIQGQAGQGKSILLRHVAIKEYEICGRLPIFIELRRVGASSELMQEIFRWFSDFGIDQGKVAIDHLARAERVSLLLDGFDELSNSHVDSVVTQLESIRKIYPKIRIAVTSRPGTAIIKDSGFSVARLQELESEDVYRVLLKLLGDSSEHDKITAALSKRPAVLSVLTTPISVALLSFVYQGTRTIPSSLWEFYNDLFPLMFERIDQMKPGFERDRECPLDKHQMQLAFDKLAFLMQNNSCLAAPEDRIVKLAENALKDSRKYTSAQSFINDIVSVTCLLVREGSQISILHRSIVEYHCARFVANFSDATASVFYTALLGKPSWRSWENVFFFLSDLDPVRIRKYYLIPEITNALDGFEIDVEFSQVVDLAADKMNRTISSHLHLSQALNEALDCGPAHGALYSGIRSIVRELFKEPRRTVVLASDIERRIQCEEREAISKIAENLFEQLATHRALVADHEERAERQHLDVISILSN